MRSGQIACCHPSSASTTYNKYVVRQGVHFDTSVDPYHRPQGWQQGEGQSAIERSAVPEGVVGCPTRASAEKAKRPIAAILSYLTLVHDEIMETYPAGIIPPVEKIRLRYPKELEAFLKEQ